MMCSYNAQLNHTGFPAQNLGNVRDSILPLQMSEEFVVTTPQPVYVLPRDHKFHGGEFYSQNGAWGVFSSESQAWCLANISQAITMAGRACFLFDACKRFGPHTAPFMIHLSALKSITQTSGSGTTGRASARTTRARSTVRTDIPAHTIHCV